MPLGSHNLLGETDYKQQIKSSVMVIMIEE